MFASTIDCFLSSLLLLPFYAIFERISGSDKVRKLLASGVSPQNIPHDLLIESAIRQMASISLQMIIITIAVMLFWFYKSATPGKMILKMKIIDAITGGKPTRKQFFIRYFGYILSTLPIGLGFMLMYYDKRHQGLHDKMAGTLVVYAENSTGNQN
jgi:hypothetical protein